jgi:TetR/AcrR family transcriptional regulator
MYSGSIIVNERNRPRKIGKQSTEVAEQTKRTMLEAALRIFAMRGFDGVSLRDIAEEAGTTHGLIRHYFGTKERLWQAAVDHAVARYAAALIPVAKRAAEHTHDPILATKEGIRQFILISAHNPDIVRLILHEGSRGGERLEYALSQFEPVGQVMAPMLIRVQQHGYLRHYDDRNFFLLLLTAGAVPFALSALVTWLTSDERDIDLRAQQHADRFIATLFDQDSKIVRNAQ